MSETPQELRYTGTHEWARLEDGAITVGISDHAQCALGDVVYVELPELGLEVQPGEEVAVVESVKAASDICAPVGGVISAVNERLDDAPETVNQDPYGDGWFFQIAPNDPTELEDLLNAEAYQEMCALEANSS